MQLARFLIALLLMPLIDAAGDDYVDSVSPYITKYCVECHDSNVHKGELDLTRYTNDGDVAEHFRRWNNVIEFIRDGKMPPEDAKQPSVDESRAVIATVEKILLAEAIKHAGDPGVILPRRLSNTEYDAAIRDLTGVDIRPTKDFPADPAGGEGFDNTGEALGTSPNLVKKYLAAAQHVADHLVLKPSGISFAPFPVTSYNERKKFAEKAIIDFYQSRDVDIDAYLEAAWRYRYRGDDQREVSIDRWAANNALSGKYLSLVWTTLSDASSQSGFAKQLGDAWNAIPAPVSDTDRPAEFGGLRDLIAFGRRVLSAPNQQVIKPGAGNWPISHLDFRARTAAARDEFDSRSLSSETLLNVTKVKASKDDESAKTVSVFVRIDPAFGEGDNFVIVKLPVFSDAGRLPNNEAEEKKQHVRSLRSVLEQFSPDLIETLGFGMHPGGSDVAPESFVVKAPAVIEIPLSVEIRKQLSGQHLLVPCQLDPEHSREGSVLVQHRVGEPSTRIFDPNAKHLIYRDSETAKKLADSTAAFCSTFPNRFFHVDKVRGLAAGFHLVEGFFRDDQPLVQKVLSDDEIVEVDRLWQELHFVTSSVETLLRGFVWFERSEREVLHDKRFDFLRAEDPRLVETELLSKFETVYLEKLAADPSGPKHEMIREFFDQIRSGLKQYRELTIVAEKNALGDVERFARRAFRRPLHQGERESLLSLYKKLRDDGQDVEASIRGLVIAVLMSPEFCYHRTTRPVGDGVSALNDHDLASRLSFFLWSTIPDQELLRAAKDGSLHSEDALVAQTRRMLKDEKIEAFAREFFGQWLRYRDYLVKDPINAESFPGYTDELRQAMFDEPVRLATHLIQTDRPITDLLNSDVTFANGALAKHYGGNIESHYREYSSHNNDQDWHRVNGLHEAGRGGLLGMAVILTSNSSGARTSPVKRGFWSVHHLLGQHFPPPPADVPELPATEKGATATIRELLATHVSDAQCAMCHSHFDSLGLAMEGFDPIGKSRTQDRAGRQVDNVATLPSGETANGIPGLIQYIQQHRHHDFVKTLCRKFLGYALGRSVELSDQPLLTKMEKSLEQGDFQFSVLFEEVVRSPQFRNQRGTGFEAVFSN